MRLDGHLMHAIAGGALAGTWPCPVTAERAARMTGARAASAPLPPAPLPSGSIAARRRVHADGRIMVNKQPMKLGPRHAGKLVTVIIEDTCYRILHGEEELAVKPRRDTSPRPRPRRNPAIGQRLSDFADPVVLRQAGISCSCPLARGGHGKTGFPT